MYKSSVRRSLAALLLPLVLLSATVSCTVDAHMDKGGKTESDSTAVDSTLARLVPVEISMVDRGPISDYIHLDGTVTTEDIVEVYSLVSGHVAQLRVEAGDRVRAGDTLMVLEDAEILLEAQRAANDLNKAEQDFARLEDLSRQKLVSSQELDEARYRLESARLGRDTAELAVTRTRVQAPISGIVAERHVGVGAWIQGSTPLFKLLDDRELIAVLNLPEKELDRIAVRQEVQVILQSSDNEVKGWIKRISPVVDPASGTVEVTVAIPDANHRLRSGMFASFAIVTGTREQAVLIPKRSIVYDRNRLIVYVIEEGKARRR
ncbi:MAG: efflux RND transporter periplasmic adaptor subunit, partial [Candidatus Cloacimonetes bacterium]|nr:efflux RND transporter periplasmic adaptor subunit [Candidatus Cloacimonadota bacterium]